MGPQTSQNQTDHTANFFWLLVLICLGFLAVWFFRPQWIVDPVYWVRLHEADFMIFLVNIWNDIAPKVHLSSIDTQKILAAQHLMTNFVPKQLSFNQFSEVNALMGKWIRWPTAFLLFLLAVFAYSRHTIIRFRQRHSMDTLKALEHENWPQIDPVLSLDLVNEDLEHGPWAMAQVPLRYCKNNNLISVGTEDGKQIWQVDKGPAARLFSLQLGPLWKDLFNLPIHVKVLIVVFVARAERERKVAKRFIVQLAASAGSGKLDFTGVNEQLIKYQHSKVLQWLRPRHAYVRTMMATLLEIARADGVLATAEFLWLKPVDRKLWYMLNSVGRQTAVVEVSGVFAHWKAEKALGRGMTTPMVKEAVKALEVSVKDILYVADNERWHSREA